MKRSSLTSALVAAMLLGVAGSTSQPTRAERPQEVANWRKSDAQLKRERKNAKRAALAVKS